MATQIEPLNRESLAEYLKSPEGQRAIMDSARQSNRKREPLSDEKIEELSKKLKEDGHYIRIDPATGKPLEESKLYFWKITNAGIVDVVGVSDADTRLSLLIQKFHRDPKLMYDVPKEVTSKGPSNERNRVHRAYSRRDEEGDLKDAGDRLIDLEDFTKQFILDPEQ